MFGIYIHIPFCKSKCTYCDFCSYPKEIGKKEAYFACLYKELKARSATLSDKVVSTIYFGGGTPSFIDAKYIYGTLKLIYMSTPLLHDSLGFHLHQAKCQTTWMLDVMKFNMLTS